MNKLISFFQTLLFTKPTISDDISTDIIDALVENTTFINGQFVQSPPSITIKPGLKLELNLDMFWVDFPKYYDAYNGTKANAVAVMINGSQYRVDLKPNENTIVLSKHTLDAVDDAVPFEQFRLGEEFMLVVGAERIENQEYILNPMWIGSMRVSS